MEHTNRNIQYTNRKYINQRIQIEIIQIVLYKSENTKRHKSENTTREIQIGKLKSGNTNRII